MVLLIAADQVNRQAMLCHRALRMVENIAKESHALTRELWESMLKFLLAITDTLLAPPKEKGKQIEVYTIILIFFVFC